MILQCVILDTIFKRFQSVINTTKPTFSRVFRPKFDNFSREIKVVIS